MAIVGLINEGKIRKRKYGTLPLLPHTPSWGEQV